MSGEHLFGREQPIERGRKTGVNGYLHDDFNDLVARQADVQTRLDVDFQLWSSVSERCQCRDGGDFTRPKIQARATVDIPERKLDEVAREVWGNVSEGCDDLFASSSVNLRECSLPSLESAFL